MDKNSTQSTLRRAGTLYIVATPIGNLDDLSARALAILNAVQFIACEDTRHTRILLERHGITTAVRSFHAHSSDAKVAALLDDIASGADAAYVSDAGTPGIADPGGVLVAAAHARGILVVPIPGPSAVIAALSVSGMHADQFIFYGYFPRKKGRQTLLGKLRDEEMTAVFYESPFRILKTITDLRTALGDTRRIFVARELTKKFEEFFSGTIQEVEAALQAKTSIKGEFVVVLAAQQDEKLPRDENADY